MRAGPQVRTHPDRATRGGVARARARVRHGVCVSGLCVRTHLDRATRGGFVQRRELLALGAVDLGASSDEDRDDACRARACVRVGAGACDCARAS
jgi:hypothetical protein